MHPVSDPNSGNTLRLERESNTPLVSIIVPVYNVAPYLEQCLESIIGQSYDNLEIILVNDGSIDNSPAICEQYALQDKRIKLVHKPNGGLSSARNAAMPLISGEFVAFVDSDDYLEREMVKCCIDKFIKYPTVGIVRFAFNEFYEDGRHYKCSSVDAGDYIHSKDEAFKHYVQGYTANCVWAAIYRSELVKHYRFLEGVYAEDIHFSLSLYLEKDFSTLFISDILYHYRVNEQSITQSKFKAMMLDALKLWETIIVQMQHVDTKKVAQINYLLFHTMRHLEIKHRRQRTSGAELEDLREIWQRYAQLIKRYPIDWSLSHRPIPHFLYWHFPRLWRLLRPRDWGVQSIRK